MKIGILTYHNTRNCGASLQAFALHKAISSMGVNCEIIDYHCKNICQTYRLQSLTEQRSLKSLAKWLLTNRSNRSAQKKFDAFNDRHMTLSPPYERANISDANQIFDGFVTGSDQVWNLQLNGSDGAYLLDFAAEEKKKISYAASFGSAVISDNHTEFFSLQLPRFDAISVRETSGKLAVHKLIGRFPSLVLDPTLLLTKEDFDVFRTPTKKQRYIFVYTIANTPHIANAAKELSQRLKLPVVWGHMSHRKHPGVLNITNLSPDEFVSYIRNADYVLTSSFHGMALSVVLEKQFFYDLDAAPFNNNSRLETLSQLLDLGNRELIGQSFSSDDIKEINYVELSKKLSVLRAESIDFLKSNLIG